MDVRPSEYISANRDVFKKLQRELSSKFEKATVLVSDSRERDWAVSAGGTRVTDSRDYGRRGFTVRVYDSGSVAEYSSNEISEAGIADILMAVDEELRALKADFEVLDTPNTEEEAMSFVKSTAYEIHPESIGDAVMLEKLAAIRERALAADERLMDCSCRVDYQQYSKLFLSDKKDMEQNVMWTCASLAVMAARGEEIKEAYQGFSILGGAELLDSMEAAVPGLVDTVTDLLDSEPMVPGEYECVCTPEVTGMIVHEAFGHGVEMDMFVKDRALAKKYMGKYVASPLVTMRDGAASAKEVASYFFDDDGIPAQDTLVIDKGVLVSGYADSLSAARLGVSATGNSRRESVERKSYTRMTNTFFEPGNDSVEEMIASVKYGMLLECPSSGMEDPKNWGIQCMVSHAREIKDGKLTGRIFSPVVLTGYVPDLLGSISMISSSVQLFGSGACGKGYKEWVKVSDGGPWIKARIRLG